MALTTVQSGMMDSIAQYNSFKNRIINGAMVIDQRNNGASITPTNGQYSVDRWQCASTVASKFSIQQNLGSITPPAGFTKYIGVTSLSAYSVLSTDIFSVQQWIEGYNVADLGFGTANASTVTLSFWVRSSLTGAFGGSLFGYNGSAFRSYAFSYTINSANTWEQKTITIPGDTTTFAYGTTNSYGIDVQFSLGVGSSLLGTANTWQSGQTYAPTGSTSVVGTNGATWYVTGVQLEKGSTATAFDYRPYGTELQLCQRYFQIYTQPALRGATNSTSTAARVGMNLQVPMRTAPTAVVGAMTGYDGSSTSTISVVNTSYLTTTAAEFDLQFASAVFVSGRPLAIIQSGTASLALSAEL